MMFCLVLENRGYTVSGISTMVDYQEDSVMVFLLFIFHYTKDSLHGYLFLKDWTNHFYGGRNVSKLVANL